MKPEDIEQIADLVVEKLQATAPAATETRFIPIKREKS
jgi:hypothetical protein